VGPSPGYASADNEMMTRVVTRFLPRDALLTAQARIEGAGLFPLFASLPAIQTQINYITYSCTSTTFKNVDLDPYEIFLSLWIALD
jgi:hypothetical protein